MVGRYRYTDGNTQEAEKRQNRTLRLPYRSDSYHLHYLEDEHPERLQKLVDEGEIYKYLDDLDTKVTDAVCRQTELLMESSKEYQIANEVGNLYKVGAIGNMLRMQARRAVFDAMVYV